MEVVILFSLVIILLFAGLPIAICLGLSSILFLLAFSDGSLASIAQTLFTAFHGHYTLLAIPFFILASTFMATGGAIASVFACMMFAALSGSSPATVIAVGTIVIAGMREVGYTKEFAAGVICNAGTLGILIPPSIVMVVYAAATDVSVGRMFLGGILPGLTAGLMLMVGIYIVALWKGLPSQPWVGWGEVFRAASDAVWGLLLIVIILGGIYGGIFTPTEAAAVAAVYAFIISNFVYRDTGPFRKDSPPRDFGTFQRVVSVLWHPDTKKTLFEAGKLTIILMFIIANALILKHVLTENRIPQMITEAMLGAGLGLIAFLIIVNIILLIGGQFMEPSGLLVIVAPLVFPIAMELGIDPIHLGIIMVVNMEIGMITPPVGLNLFVTAGVAQMPVMQVVRSAIPFVGILFLFLILVTYVPTLSTWLPTFLMGPEIITE